MERVCPRDERAHGPHDERALFCWVCGRDLICEECRIPVERHDLYKQCPAVLTPVLKTA